MSKTQLVIVPGRTATRDAVFHIIVAETGEHLASHLCSHYGFAMGDLYEGRPDRKKEYHERFGEIDVKYIDDLDFEEEELLRRNKSWYEGLDKSEQYGEK